MVGGKTWPRVLAKRLNARWRDADQHL